MAGPWALLAFGRTLLSYMAAGVALTWSFTKIILAVEARGIVVLF